MKNIDEAQSHHLFYVYLLAIDNQDAFRASWHTYAGSVIDGVGSAVVVVVGFDTVDACYHTFAAADITFAILVIINVLIVRAYNNEVSSLQIAT